MYLILVILLLKRVSVQSVGQTVECYKIIYNEKILNLVLRMFLNYLRENYLNVFHVFLYS